MKKLFIRLLALVSLWLVAECISANPITETEALKRANQFMPNKHFSARKYSPRFASCQAAPPFYIFNADEGGFVLVSGDDRTMPILGYSEHDQLDLSQAPENLLYWLDCYAQQIENLDNGYRAVTIGASLTDAAAISPLIQTKWNQYGPYNAQCPYWPGSSERCLTGCVATCMAQIMYYYKWPEHCPAIPAYTPDGFSQPLDELPPVDFKWDDMQLTYGYNEEGSAADAVAQLMRYCGQSVEMQYGLEGSSAWLDPEVMIETFDYSDSTALTFRKYYTEAEWESIIYQELAKGHPVPYSGKSKESGHQFICDGYNNGYYHINWGWGGHYDSYYLLSVANPYTDGRSGYSQNQYAIIGLEPKSVPSDYAVKSFTFSEDVLLNEETEVKIVLTNQGKTSRERLFLWMKQDDSWTMIATETSTVEAGQTDEVVMTFVPTTDGVFDMKLTSDIEGEVVKATATILVVEPVEKVAGDLVYLCNNISKHAFVKGVNPSTSIYACVIPETVEAEGVTYTVVEIREKAFGYKYSLNRVELPSTLTKIGSEAFLDCRNLEIVTSHIKHPFVIRDNTFSNQTWNDDTHDYDIVEPTAVLYVPEGSKPEYEAISGWTHFAKVVEGKPQEVVVGNLRYLCLPDPNTAIVLPDESYKKMTEVNIPERMESGGTAYSVVGIDKDAFSGCVITTVTLPSTLKSIGADAFYNCYKLKEVIIPEGCESIKIFAFAYCWNLKKLVLPASLTYMGSYVFYGMQSLSSVISHSTTPCVVSDDVFAKSTWDEEKQSYYYEPSPATLYVPVGSKDEYIAKGWDQFVKISEGLPEEAVIEGLRYQLLTTDKTAIVLSDESYKGLTEVNIPERVEYDGTVYSVVGIDRDAFESCLRITAVTLPTTLKSIGVEAFYNCSKLKEVIIPEECETIGSYAFAYCYRLQKLVLPAKLSSLGDNAFSDISTLVSVVSPCKSPCNISENVFSKSTWNAEKQDYDYEPSPATLYVPVGCKTDYIAKGWDQFAAIVEDDESGIDIVIDNGRQNDDGMLYNLYGQRVTSPQTGIFIQNGKKILIR